MIDRSRPDTITHERVCRGRQGINGNQHHDVNTTYDIRHRQLPLPQMLHSDKEHKPSSDRQEILQHREHGNIQHPFQQAKIERTNLVKRIFTYIYGKSRVNHEKENRYRLGYDGSDSRPLNTHLWESGMSENQKMIQ